MSDAKSAGESGFARTAGEQGVAREQVRAVVPAVHQGDRAGRVAAQVDHLQRHPAHRDRAAVLDRVVDGHRQLGGVEGVRDLAGAELVGHRAEGLPVVVVAVRGDRGAQLSAAGRGDDLRQPVRLVRRVDQQRLSGRGAHQEVGVVVHRADRDLRDGQGAEVAAGGGATGVRMAAVGVEDVHDRGAYGLPQELGEPSPPVGSRRDGIHRDRRRDPTPSMRRSIPSGPRPAHVLIRYRRPAGVERARDRDERVSRGLEAVASNMCAKLAERSDSFSQEDEAAEPLVRPSGRAEPASSSARRARRAPSLVRRGRVGAEKLVGGRT